MLCGKIMLPYTENLAKCINALYRQSAESVKGEASYTCGYYWVCTVCVVIM